eukprot:3379071-Amphidinium_carterae.1
MRSRSRQAREEKDSGTAQAISLDSANGACPVVPPQDAKPEATPQDDVSAGPPRRKALFEGPALLPPHIGEVRFTRLPVVARQRAKVLYDALK